MQAALFSEFKKPIGGESVSIPELQPKGVIIKVMATGICRSDWHGWIGYESI